MRKAKRRKPPLRSKDPTRQVEGVQGKRGQSVPFKEGNRLWDRMVAKKELDEELDEAEELWKYLRGKASKIDFSDSGDGELNLIAAALFKEQQRRELGEKYEPPRASRSPSRARKWSNWDTRQPRPSRQERLKEALKQDVWKDVPEHKRTSKGQLDDEATFYIDRIPVKNVEWAIQQSDSNGGFQCSDSENLVKYKVWPNNTQKSLHPSQKTWRKTTFALAQVNEHERYVASKAERLAKKMANVPVPSSALAASSAADATADKKPKMKKRKGPDDSSAADSDPQELAGFLDDSAPWWRIIENRIPMPRADGPSKGWSRPPGVHHHVVLSTCGRGAV